MSPSILSNATFIRSWFPCEFSACTRVADNINQNYFYPKIRTNQKTGQTLDGHTICCFPESNGLCQRPWAGLVWQTGRYDEVREGDLVRHLEQRDVIVFARFAEVGMRVLLYDWHNLRVLINDVCVYRAQSDRRRPTPANKERLIAHKPPANGMLPTITLTNRRPTTHRTLSRAQCAADNTNSSLISEPPHWNDIFFWSLKSPKPMAAMCGNSSRSASVPPTIYSPELGCLYFEYC